MTLFVGGGAGIAQTRIQLAQGRRAIQEKVTFVIDVQSDKSQNPRYAEAPEDVQIYSGFADRPASGRVYLDGKAIGRFDESMAFNGNSIPISYGRHTITLALTNPAILAQFYVTVRGGVLREILDDQEPEVALTPDLSKRVTELERKVNNLESELTSLKKKRNH